ncbi:hypothetical protein [Streptococcus uberis]|uniref:hypothetical protein n=1 Tax=Streptococcus uberis TaxID=1349 RepID=UPI001FF49AB4|nr:hypothetical protein [Streptococcus uberis]MCK1226716.1 hypothetical protein [Streptococcus uberis]MCK1241336.1 hypothetical protein [Streptococcus uberis]
MSVNDITNVELLINDYLKIAKALVYKPDFLRYSREEEQWRRENPNCNMTRLRRLGKEIRIKMQEVEE